MTFTPSDAFKNRMVQVGGHWIDALTIGAVGAIDYNEAWRKQEPDSAYYDFRIYFRTGGTMDVEAKALSDIEPFRATVLHSWDTAIQRAQLEKQFERGLEVEEPPTRHGGEADA